MSTQFCLLLTVTVGIFYLCLNDAYIFFLIGAASGTNSKISYVHGDHYELPAKNTLLFMRFRKTFNLLKTPLT